MSHKKLFLLLCLGVFLSYGRDANAQNQTFNYTGSLQTWTVPCATSITITANGAQGGTCIYGAGGLGAKITGTFSVTPGQVLDILVGQAGTGGPQAPNYFYCGSGGGGSYVWNSANSSLPMVVAGGGGGGSDNGNGSAGVGSATQTATPAIGGQGSVAGGSGGQGGAAGAWSGSGAGWLTNGGNGSAANGGQTPTNGGAGGTYTNPGWTGGYGGGGGCNGNNGSGGGGGGYNGGGGGIGGGNWGSGGGGGSYNGGTNPSATAGINAGNGSVTITWVVSNLPVSVVGHVINNVLCSGVNNGKVNGITTGVGLTYLWQPGGQTNDTATGLSAGTYTISVVSVCGGSASASITVTQPPPFVVNVSATGNVSCNGQSNGSANSTVVGGSSPYTYSWTPSGGNAATANGLSAGTYTLSVADNNGCTGSGSVTITQPQVLSVVTSSPINDACFGQNNGKATSLTNGGTQPYTYSWSNGSSTNSAAGLSAGTYTLDVWDAHGCTVSATATITQPARLAVGAGTTLNNLCYNNNIGIIVAYVAGGPMPYTYAWTPAGGNKDSAMGMSAGTYNVLVTDASGCTGTSTTTVTQPSQVKVGLDQVPDDGGCTGAAWLSVSGGISPYNYLWTDGNTTFKIINQCTGNYCCVVTDANGCMSNTCASITTDAGVGTVTSGGGKIKIYPNPTNGAFTVNVSGVSGSAAIEVYDVLGAKVYSAALDMTKGGNTTVNIANHSNGIYLYRIISSENGSLLGEGKIALEK